MRRDDLTTRQGTKSWTQTMLDKHGDNPHIRHDEEREGEDS